jgi:hypothetical protein
MNVASLPPPANPTANPSTSNLVVTPSAGAAGSTSTQGESLQVKAAPAGLQMDPAKVATPAKVEAPKVETPKVDPLAAAKAVAAAKRGAVRYREQAARQIAQTESRASQTAAQLAIRDAEAKSAQAQLDAIKKDPLAALKTLGISKEDLYRSAVLDGTPEAQLAQLRKEVQEEREALRKDRETEKAAREHATRQAKQTAAESAFLGAAQDATAYPHLAGEPGRVVLLVAKDMLEGAVKRGVDVSGFTDAEILSALDKYYAGHKKAAETPSAAAPPGAKESGNQAPPRTISNDLASSSFSQPGKAPSAATDDWGNRKHLAGMIKGRFKRSA